MGREGAQGAGSDTGGTVTLVAQPKALESSSSLDSGTRQSQPQTVTAAGAQPGQAVAQKGLCPRQQRGEAGGLHSNRHQNLSPWQ